MRVPVPDEIPPLASLGRVHLVGIGGAALSGIARILLARGVSVSGSDGTDSPGLATLRDLGATVHLGHDAAHVGGLGPTDTLVVSTAIHDDNPEYVEAVRRGLTVLPRSAALASVMGDRRVVAVAGTHGKTTTTSLLTVALQAAGADPSYAIGGDLAATGVNAAVGSGDVFVAEADESDGAFLVYDVHAAIVTNVDADHLDQWGTPEAYAAAFDEFADALDPDGFLVCCVDDAGAAALAARQRAEGRRVITVTATDASALEGTALWAPGDHYVADALAALAAGEALGHDRADLLRGI
ncbi:Mur ligase domain-containing protein, partial [Nocardioides sp.]|uniref:Mur ligase domain-containing protein n=1 Tax=Nocardioides sp. TaxID=35761 RepID=UPI002719CC5C